METFLPGEGWSCGTEGVSHKRMECWTGLCGSENQAGPIYPPPCRPVLTPPINHACLFPQCVVFIFPSPRPFRCSVDKPSAPFLEKGYIMACLASHSAQLHKPCWSLISTMDDRWVLTGGGGVAWKREWVVWGAGEGVEEDVGVGVGGEGGGVSV
jgi:hypothetical protein